MRANYIIFFILGAILGLIVLVLWKKDFNFKEDLVLCGKAMSIGGIGLDILLLILTPTVLIIKDGKQYEEHDYFFYYIDSKGESHFLSYNGHYIDNQTSKTIYVYAAVYRKHDYGDYFSDRGKIPDTDEYLAKEFGWLKHIPEYIFTLPPPSMMTKNGSSVTVWVLDDGDYSQY